MNKISNLSMMVSSLLFLCISISNVYGVDPRKFKLNFGTLTNRIDPATKQFEGLYYRLECNEDEAGEGKTIWKSYTDGYDYTEGESSTFFPFSINGQESKLTPWHIESRDYYYGCDLYLWCDGDIGRVEINLKEFTNMAEVKNEILYNPDDFRAPAPFDVDISAESEIYDGEYKYNFELQLQLTTNLNTVKRYSKLYYQLECSDKVKPTTFKCIEDGYDWQYYESTGTKMYVMPFSLGLGGDSNAEMLTSWQIDTKNDDGQDLYFFECDLYIMQIGTLGDSSLAKSSVPLNSFPDDESKWMEMYFYKIGADEEKDAPIFHLTYYGSQKGKKTEIEIDEDE